MKNYFRVLCLLMCLNCMASNERVFAILKQRQNNCVWFFTKDGCLKSTCGQPSKKKPGIWHVHDGKCAKGENDDIVLHFKEDKKI